MQSIRHYIQLIIKHCALMLPILFERKIVPPIHNETPSLSAVRTTQLCIIDKDNNTNKGPRLIMSKCLPLC